MSRDLYFCKQAICIHQSYLYGSQYDGTNISNICEFGRQQTEPEYWVLGRREVGGGGRTGLFSDSDFHNSCLRLANKRGGIQPVGPTNISSNSYIFQAYNTK